MVRAGNGKLVKVGKKSPGSISCKTEKMAKLHTFGEFLPGLVQLVSRMVGEKARSGAHGNSEAGSIRFECPDQVSRSNRETVLRRSGIKAGEP